MSLGGLEARTSSSPWKGRVWVIFHSFTVPDVLFGGVEEA